MRKEVTRENVPHTQKILFWSTGEMSKEAFNKAQHFWSSNKQRNAKSILSEWIIKN